MSTAAYSYSSGGRNMAAVFVNDQVSSRVCDDFELVPPNLGRALDDASLLLEIARPSMRPTMADRMPTLIVEMRQLMASLSSERVCTRLTELVAEHEGDYTDLVSSVGTVFGAADATGEADELVPASQRRQDLTALDLFSENIRWLTDANRRLSQFRISLASVSLLDENQLMQLASELIESPNNDHLDIIVANWMQQQVVRIRGLSPERRQEVADFLASRSDYPSASVAATLAELGAPESVSVVSPGVTAAAPSTPMDIDPRLSTWASGETKEKIRLLPDIKPGVAGDVKPAGAASVWLNPSARSTMPTQPADLSKMRTSGIIDITGGLAPPAPESGVDIKPGLTGGAPVAPTVKSEPAVVKSEPVWTVPAQTPGVPALGTSPAPLVEGLRSSVSPSRGDSAPNIARAAGALSELTYQFNVGETPVVQATPAAPEPEPAVSPVMQSMAGSFVPIKSEEGGPDASLIAASHPAYAIPAGFNPAPIDPSNVYPVPPPAPLPMEVVPSGYEFPRVAIPSAGEFASPRPDLSALYGDADPSPYSFVSAPLESRTSTLYDPASTVLGGSDGRLATDEYWDPAVVGVDRVVLHPVRDGQGSWFQVPELLNLTANTGFTSDELIGMVRATAGPRAVSVVTERTTNEKIPVVRAEALVAMLRNTPETCPTRDMCIASLARCLEKSVGRTEWTSNIRESSTRPSVDFMVRRAKLAVNVDDEVVRRRPTTRLELANHNFNVLEYSAGRPLGLFVDFLGTVCNQMLQKFNGAASALDPLV